MWCPACGLRMILAWDWGRWYWYCLPDGLYEDIEGKPGGGALRA
jgi:hypothetical protein